MKKTPAPKRSTGFTRISVNLPDDLLADLDAVAAADKRTRSNLLIYTISRLIVKAQITHGLSLKNRPHHTYCPKSTCYEGPDDAC